MTQGVAPDCIFCAISAGQAPASIVYEDESVLAFMALYAVTPGHLLVIPRRHAVGLDDLDPTTSAHVWSVGHQLARALRRSTLRPDGMNLFVCDGEAAFQDVFHFHLHVIPRYVGDGWTLDVDEVECDRTLLDSRAQLIREAWHTLAPSAEARGQDVVADARPAYAPSPPRL